MRCFASSAKMLQHHILVNDLSEAILHWSKLVIRKWSTHIWNDPVSQGSAMAGFIPQQATVSSSSMVHGVSIQIQVDNKACTLRSSEKLVQWIQALSVHCARSCACAGLYMDRRISKSGDKWSFGSQCVTQVLHLMKVVWYKAAWNSCVPPLYLLPLPNPKRKLIGARIHWDFYDWFKMLSTGGWQGGWAIRVEILAIQLACKVALLPFWRFFWGNRWLFDITLHSFDKRLSWIIYSRYQIHNLHNTETQ